MNTSTEFQYREIISECKEIFAKKTKDYGTAWRILRLPSITDQIFIKAQRIRSIQEKGDQKVEDSISEIDKMNEAIEEKLAKGSEDESMLDKHDSFFEKAAKFAEGDYNQTEKEGEVTLTKDPDYQPTPSEGKVPGFEDLDGDGNEIIDDAIIDEEE